MNRPFRGWIAMIELMRPFACTVGAGYSFAGAYLARPQSAEILRSNVPSFVVLLLVLAFGFIVNDLYDLHVDETGKPNRPLPSKRVSVRAAAMAAIGFCVLCLAISLWVSIQLALMATASLTIAFCYSRYLKKTILYGNVIMALMVASTVLYGAWSARNVSREVIFSAVLLFLSSLSHEILFTREDATGDRIAGLHTFAVAYGSKATTRIYCISTIASIVAGIIPWIMRSASVHYGLAFVALVALPSIWNVYTLCRNDTDANIRVAVVVSRLIWITGFVPLFLMVK